MIKGTALASAAAIWLPKRVQKKNVSFGKIFDINVTVLFDQRNAGPLQTGTALL